MIDEAMKGESFVVDRLETRQMVDDRQMSLFWLCCASSFFFFFNRIEEERLNSLEERLNVNDSFGNIFFDLDLLYG